MTAPPTLRTLLPLQPPPHGGGWPVLSAAALPQVPPTWSPDQARAVARDAGAPGVAVVEQGTLLGVLNWADLKPPSHPVDARQLYAALPAPARGLLEQLAVLAGPRAQVALVGGAVRDLLLQAASETPDLDIVVSGVEVELLLERLGLPRLWHPAYRNATLTLPGGLVADVVSARMEQYPQPGASPLPFPGTLMQDLQRRDFSVNALALLIGPDGQPVGLRCPEGALDDLAARTLRPLHDHSFRDDASRLIRAARLAARLDLRAHPALLAQVPDALREAPHTPRLWAELRLLLDEPAPGRAAWRLQTWGAGTLLPEGAAEVLERLDARQPAPGATLAAAALYSRTPDAPALARQLGLGERALDLLARARSDRPYPPGTPEATLREVLGLAPPYPPLQGRDLLSLGLPPGPQVGEVLAHLSRLRAQHRLHSRDDEVAAVQAYLAERG
ncbi:CCA tRNA nucleotidyltransferase [Deinococcus sonorensis]|uniref:CCA tRNA nucleotidyltransferase n=2 Tax=Deinococcus sonorensis TaxID=309891 RepID=A0AAU7U959_9DEIO